MRKIKVKPAHKTAIIAGLAGFLVGYVFKEKITGAATAMLRMPPTAYGERWFKSKFALVKREYKPSPAIPVPPLDAERYIPAIFMRRYKP